jgi:hypothetical protein
MALTRTTVIAAATGAAGAAAALLPSARCAGGTCAACFGCAGIIVSLALTALFKRSFARRSDHGMAEDRN